MNRRRGTATITAAAFHADPRSAYLLAGRVAMVRVVDASGRVRMVISRQ